MKPKILLSLSLFMAFFSICLGLTNDHIDNFPKEFEVVQKDTTQFHFLKNVPFKNIVVKEKLGVSDTIGLRYLSIEEKKLLEYDKIYNQPQPFKWKAWVQYRLKISSGYRTLVIRHLDFNGKPVSILVNYDLNYKLIDFKHIAYFDWEKYWGEATIWKSQVMVSHHRGNRTDFEYYLFDKQGHMKKLIHKSTRQLLDEGKLLETRVVKAPSGLIIRDSLGNRVGKYNFGETVNVLTYSEDFRTISDNGKSVRGRTAKVILDLNQYVMDLTVPSEVNNIGYVFEGFLFKSGDLVLDYGEVADVSENDPRYYYYSFDVFVGGIYNSVKIDIREFLSIEKVSEKDFVSQVIEEESYKQNFNYEQYKNRFKLNFDDGTQRVFKDTTYLNHEFEPSDHYELVTPSVVKDSYLIYHSFFEDSRYTILNKSDGDTIFRFEDYPFISPNSEMAISVKVPYSHEETTALMEIVKIKDGVYTPFVGIEFIHWNKPNNLRIHWLSDEEFVLRVKKVEYAFSDEEEAEYFYLKFKVRS